MIVTPSFWLMHKCYSRRSIPRLFLHICYHCCYVYVIVVARVLLQFTYMLCFLLPFMYHYHYHLNYMLFCLLYGSCLCCGIDNVVVKANLCVMVSRQNSWDLLNILRDNQWYVCPRIAKWVACLLDGVKSSEWFSLRGWSYNCFLKSILELHAFYARPS